tara:strand:+ start:78 stop:389 length:312 start_codon:yes stop_codon:yes gene_type:complete
MIIRNILAIAAISMVLGGCEQKTEVSQAKASVNVEASTVPASHNAVSNTAAVTTTDATTTSSTTVTVDGVTNTVIDSDAALGVTSSVFRGGVSSEVLESAKNK